MGQFLVCRPTGNYSIRGHKRVFSVLIQSTALNIRIAPGSRTPSPLLGYISSFIGSYLTHERPTRPISKAKASGWETGSTFCSRGPDRQSAYLPSEDDSLQTKGESSVRKQVTALRRASTLLRTFPWRDGPPRELA